MDRKRSTTIALVTLAALSMLCGCNRPISDPVKLKTIKSEAQFLMTTHPARPLEGWIEIPKGQWPPAIASLDPEIVTIRQWGVEITVKSYFDGGWGYEIPRNKRDLPMPAQCYSEPSEGVFWHGPC